jgi:hypothetical protein
MMCIYDQGFTLDNQGEKREKKKKKYDRLEETGNQKRNPGYVHRKTGLASFMLMKFMLMFLRPFPLVVHWSDCSRFDHSE